MIDGENKINEIIGARIKQARVIAGLSQEDLSSLVNLSFQQIQKYESGTNAISAAKLQIFARHLNKPIMFFYNTHDGVDATVGNSDLSDRAIVGLVKGYSKIPSQKARALVSELIKHLSE